MVLPGNSVAKRISTALPVTMQLTFIGLAIGAVVSFLLGVIAALYRDKWPDQVIRVFSIAGLATPSFWLAVLLILLFSSYLKVLPAPALCLTSPRIRLAIWGV